MGYRLDLQNELETFLDNVYFQPPSSEQMTYPCIVYAKMDKARKFGGDRIYIWTQLYQVTVIERNPDSTVADDIENQFNYCIIDQRFTVDNLYHTTLSLYY